MSRSHGFGAARGLWLTPVLDLANHAPAAEGGAELSVGSAGEVRGAGGGRAIAQHARREGCRSGSYLTSERPLSRASPARTKAAAVVLTSQ